MTDNTNRRIYEFGANKYISKIQDFKGNTMTFGYNASNQLTNITDTKGKTYSLTYTAFHKLLTLQDTLGNEVDFDYYSSGSTDENGTIIGNENDLRQITLKKGTATKNILFTYDNSHNIAKLYDSKGQVYVENTYTPLWSTDSYQTVYGVASQQYGNGTLHYAYETGSVEEVQGVVKGITKNTVTDRSGNITEYIYDGNGNTIQKEIHTATGSIGYFYLYDGENRLTTETFPK